MRFDRAAYGATEVDDELMWGVAPGKRTCTAAIQRQVLAGAPPTPAPASPPAPAPAAPRADGPAPEPFWFADGPAAGASLAPAVQAKMERAFQADFSDVQIHQGGNAEALGAIAYAQGADLHFAPGAYDPSSERGQALIGHELAHVVQQREGRVAAGPQGKDAPINRDASLEAEADTLGAAAARGEIVRTGPVSLPSSATPAIQRAIEPGKQDFLDRRVRGFAGNGTIVEVVGNNGYTVRFDDGGPMYATADALDFLEDDEEEDGNDIVVEDDTVYPYQPYHHGMADKKVLSTAAQGVAQDLALIKQGGKQWADAAIQSIIRRLTQAYPGMPPIRLMPTEDVLKEKSELGESSPDASFHEDLWQIYVDPKYLTMELTAENLAKLAEFVVHEMRHADQYWRAAKMRCEESDDSDQTIAEALGIPAAVVKAARGEQQKKDLSLQNEQLMEAEAINRSIPLMVEANEKTKAANAYEEMIRIEQELIQHQKKKETYMKQIEEAGNKGPELLQAWFNREKENLGKFREMKQKLTTAQSELDEESDEWMKYEIMIGNFGQMIDNAEDSMKDIVAHSRNELSWSAWKEQIKTALQKHYKSIEEHERSIGKATEAYRKDALENDARWCGETFSKELGTALNKK